MDALQNLYDYAWDDRVKCAARMVLDYVSAKVAVSSNGLRRAPPFRRLLENAADTKLFGDSCDAQTSRFIILSGLTARLGDVGFKAAWGGRDQLLLAALTSYRAPELILDILLDKSHNEYHQQFHHGDRPPVVFPAEVLKKLAGFGIRLVDTIPGGVEIYASSREFLVSAGGIWLRSGNLDSDEFVGYKDNGNALPTTLMPSRAGADRVDFIRVAGAYFDRDRINTGVLPGFACGLNITIPPSFLKTLLRTQLHPANFDPPGHAQPLDLGIVRNGYWTFIDASASSQNWHCALNLYIAAYIHPCETLWCFTASGSLHLSKPYYNADNFGFFEATSADRMPFGQFVNEILSKNGGRSYSSEGQNVYQASDGRVIEFTPNPGTDGYQWGIHSINGQTFDTNIHNWPLVRGDIMNTDPSGDGHNGYVTVDNPYLKQKLVLDMRDPMIPRRYQFRVDAPRHTAGGLVSRDIYRLDTFWVAPDGALAATYWDAYVNKARWGLPIPITGPALAHLRSPVVSVSRKSELIDLFWIGADGQVWTQWRSLTANGSEWNIPFALPGVAPTDRPSLASKLAAVCRIPEQLDVFWIGPDGAVRTHYLNENFPQGTWDAHTCFQITPAGAARPDSALAVIGRIPEQLDAFWIGSDGGVYTHWWSGKARDGNWGEHSHWPIAPPGSARADSPITAVAKSAGHIDVFWIAPDGAVRTQWWDEYSPEGQWHQHEPFNIAPPGSVAAGSALASASRVPSQVDVFWRTTAGAVATAYWSDYVAHRAWADGVITPPNLVHPHSPIHVLGREPEQLDVIWVGIDLAVWTQWWNGRIAQGQWWQHDPFAVTPVGAVTLPT